MKQILFLVLLLIGGSAFATTPSCYPLGIKGQSQFDPSYVGRLDSGSSGGWAGWFVYWFCKNPANTPQWTVNYFYCINSGCDTSAIAGNFYSIASTPDNTTKVTRLDGILTSAAVRPCDAEIANNTQFAPICTIILQKIAATAPAEPVPPPPPPPPPAPGKYVVKPNGTASTRVVFGYNASTNTRGSVTNLTVAVGSPCDPTITVVEKLGALVTTYMGVPGGIAVCTLAQ